MFLEIETLSSRLNIIQSTYSRTTNSCLKERLIIENKLIYERVNEISSIAKLLKKRSIDQISLSDLLFEKCQRTIDEINLKKLFFI